jgi:hypothetical protein
MMRRPAVEGHKKFLQGALKMPFILTGFRQDLRFRVFAFERRDAALSRMAFTVKADLDLIRRYNIRLQELPLLCRSFLERRNADDACALTFTEDEMRAWAENRTAARDDAARKKKMPRKPASQTPGAAWR